MRYADTPNHFQALSHKALGCTTHALNITQNRATPQEKSMTCSAVSNGFAPGRALDIRNAFPRITTLPVRLSRDRAGTVFCTIPAESKMNGKMMKGIVTSLAGMLVMACSGCGGGGGGSAPDQTSKPAPAPVVVKKAINIDAEGDSTIHGAQVVNGVTSQTPNSAPAVLQATFRSAGFDVTVQNSGQNGATADSAIEGLQPWYSATLATRLSTNPAQIVIGNYAINDSTLRTTDQYTADLTQWISTVRASGKTAILEEPNPVCAGYVSNLDAYVAAMRVVAQQQNVTLIAQYDYLKSLPNWKDMLTDCVHPKDEMYAIKAQREYDVLAPIVKSMM